ncbi:hypothetical protein CLF_101602 [Clonorchis sinensis]|uniref:Reverse transcriptase domain-containing protein n=1 Tax=Clonorchis sinensis TaxID=79923 RepID=G7Y646_CLOSI|nr:hypothetical protein CLF_101602 [Clonorchis sinensis]
MGSDPTDLLGTLEQVFSHLKEAGFRLRAEKCNFPMESVKFLGFMVDKRGRRPDPAYIEVIKQMAPPKDVQLRSFLGLISHTILLAYASTTQYRSTQLIGQADALSRLIKSHPMENDCVIVAVKFESEVHQILIEGVKRFPATAETIHANTSKEEILLKVMNYVQTKWPIGEIFLKLRPFFNRRESLSIVANCLMTRDRVVVPAKLQK